jgi:tight adherence protein C
MLTVGIIIIAVVFAIVLVVVALRAPEARDPIQQRLTEYGDREIPVTLEEIELSQGFYDRIILPLLNNVGKMVMRFTPQATLENARIRLEMAGNPMRIEPAFFLATRIVLAVLMGGMIFIVFAVSRRNWVQGLMLSALFTFLGYSFPDMFLTSIMNRRQKDIFRSMPDALDLLTISVEAGLGFDAAMAHVHDKWDDTLSLEFGRVLREIRLGKTRRDSLRSMADRLGVPELTSFVAAVIQSEQLGVSMGTVLRIQSDQMRIRRRQMAEEEAQKAPVKIVFPIGMLIFPSLLIILLGPAILQMMTSPMGAMFR